MRTARFLTLALFLASTTFVMGCGGAETSPDDTMTEAEDAATTDDDSTMMESDTGEVMTP